MPQHPVSWVRGHLASAVLGSAVGRRQLTAVSVVLDYANWQQETFGSSAMTPTRGALWKTLSARMQSSAEQWHVLEFGVAFGHATSWWLRHHDKSVIASWDGFDRFEGLPQNWRHLPAGTYDAGGQTPKIEDDRIAWHCGDVEDTIAKMDENRIASGRRFVLFDLDLYEPSKIAWDWLRPHLRTGDFLYFDESYDEDERRLIINDVLPAGSYSRIGGTPLALALEIRSLD
jgi:hypothetical protein